MDNNNITPAESSTPTQPLFTVVLAASFTREMNWLRKRMASNLFRSLIDNCHEVLECEHLQYNNPDSIQWDIVVYDNQDVPGMWLDGYMLECAIMILPESLEDAEQIQAFRNDFAHDAMKHSNTKADFFLYDVKADKWYFLDYKSSEIPEIVERSASQVLGLDFSIIL